MSHTASDAVFAGSVPQIYERYFVPLIFEPYAIDLARRAAALRPTRMLETAAGTGVVTRALARALPASAEIVATDLNPPMLAQAAAIGTARPVQWQQADAMQLPFGDASFDLVVCQFGVMFFPDRVQAFAQARRVLRAGGTLLFNVWDGIEHNELADVVTQTLAEVFPADPPRFMARTPHGHGDLRPLFEELRAAGFAAAPHSETIAARSGAASAGDAAFAYCQGTPLRNEIEARQSPDLAAATAACTAAIARRFGDGLVDTKLQAHVVSVAR